MPAGYHRLRRLRFIPRVKDEAGTQQFPFVVFAAPPSGSANYVAEVRAALQLWDGTGTFVFTGSAGVYSVDDGSQCNEDSPVTPHGVNERTDRYVLLRYLATGYYCWCWAVLHPARPYCAAFGCIDQCRGACHLTLLFLVCRIWMWTQSWQ